MTGAGPTARCLGLVASVGCRADAWRGDEAPRSFQALKATSGQGRMLAERPASLGAQGEAC